MTTAYTIEGRTTIPTGGRALALGFAATAAMWAMGYVALMKPGLVLGEALFAVTALCAVVAGVVAGRASRAGEAAWLAGLVPGLVSGCLNLLIVGSLLGGETEAQKLSAAGWWAGGTLLGCALLGAIGGAIGGLSARRDRPRNWFGLFTTVAAATVFLLLLTGGLVTGLEAGLAVPDWPTSFGHNMLLYPLSEMVGGVYYEHAHRLYGMLVGVTAIALLVASLLLDVRPWLRGLAAALLALVAVQGILGGMRVTQANLVLAIVHGVLGQVLFALATAIAAFTATTWHRAGVRPAPTAEAERRGTRLLVAVLLVQLVLGALYRHLNADAAIHIGAKHGLLTVHILVGLLIAHLAVLHGGRAWGRHREAPVLPVVGRTLIILVCVQLLLGIGAAAAVMLREPGAAVPVLEVIVTTAHQATGALLLAAATLLAIWTRRLVALASAAA